MPATRTKSAIIQKLLARKGGATVTQLQAAIAWQPHSIRAALSGLRKKGTAITRSTNAKGVTVYAIETPPPLKHGGSRNRMSSASSGPAR